MFVNSARLCECGGSRALHRVEGKARRGAAAAAGRSPEKAKVKPFILAVGSRAVLPVPFPLLVAGLTPEEAEEKPFIASMGIYVFKKNTLIKLLQEVRHEAGITLRAAVKAANQGWPLNGMRKLMGQWNLALHGQSVWQSMGQANWRSTRQ